MHQDPNLHSLTHVVINDLQKASNICPDRSTEGLIKSAIMAVKSVHDQLLNVDCSSTEIDPEEYCTAI